MDINPKADLKQANSSVKHILDLGTTAARQHNWTQVGQYLQRLPLSSRQKKLTLTDAEWNLAFELAVAVLFEGDFQQQWDIAKTIPLLGKRIIEPLTAILEDEGARLETRWFICKIFAKFNDKAIILSLIRLIQQTEDEELIAVASQTLTKIGRDAIDSVIELLTDPECCFVAVQILAYIRHPQIIDPLIEFVDRSQPEIRAIVIEALGSFHDDRVLPILLNALQDKASAVRKEAAIALGFRQDICETADLVSKLQPLLYDLNLDVCRHTAISLGRMKNQAAATALFAALQSQTTPVKLKIELVKALGWTEIDLSLDYLRQALTKEFNPIDREIISILGRISFAPLKAKASQILIDFWNSERGRNSEDRIKQTLATSLGQLGYSTAKISLEELAEDENKSVKLHAIAALKRLSNFSSY